jgi:hypothetical protein
VRDPSESWMQTRSNETFRLVARSEQSSQLTNKVVRRQRNDVLAHFRNPRQRDSASMEILSKSRIKNTILRWSCFETSRDSEAGIYSVTASHPATSSTVAKLHRITLSVILLSYKILGIGLVPSSDMICLDVMRSSS